MHMLKLLFQELQIRPILAPRRHSRPPGVLLKITAWGTSRGIRAIVFPEETDHPPLGTAKCPGQECCSFFHLILPEFQNPSQHLLYSLV